MPARKKIVSQKRSPKKNSLQIRLSIIGLFVIFVGAGIWSFLRSQMAPSDINLIATEKEVSTSYVRPGIVDSDGCYYQQIECIKAPCEPIRVCTPTSTPVATISSSISPRPSSSIVATAIPYPTYSATPVATPLICTRDLYLCPDGTKVGRSGPNCEFICPKATPVPSPVSSPYAQPTSIGLSSFKATNTCGSSSFTTISYACNNSSVEVLLSNSECLDFTRAYKTAYAACSVTPTAVETYEKIQPTN